MIEGLLYYYPTAFILGALHSFEPAHGKAVLVAYLIGSRRSFYHTILFGLAIAVAHTFSVMVLGLVAWLASREYDVPLTGSTISLFGGLLVLGIGFWMLLRWRVGACPHPGHGHHGNSLEDGNVTENGKGQTQTSLTQLLILGFSGGLVPCPSGVAMLLTAVAAGNPGEGLGLAASFSLGAGVVVVLLSALIYRTSAVTDKWLAQTGSFAEHMPMVSSLLIIGIGMWLSASAFVELTAHVQ